MVTQAHHLQLTPLLANTLNTLHKNTSSVTARSPPQLITRCRHVPRSQISTAAPKREKDARKRVVITGMGLVSVFGNNVDTYYERLLAGESGVKSIDRFDASEFPMQFGAQICGFDSDGYIMAKNDRRLDDCQRYCIVAGKKALEDAALGGDQLSKINKERAGVLVGTGIGGTTVMESLEHAMKRDAPIIAEYLGGAINFDAYNITAPRPDGFGVATCIQSCLLNAGVSVEEVNYINAHATSTKVGDIAEITALKNVFKNHEGIKINATKSMIGHALAAAGGMEAIATIKAIQTGWLHPTINQFNLDPEVEFDTVANRKQQHEINVAISNSFGFGGHNSVVAFSAFKP